MDENFGGQPNPLNPKPNIGPNLTDGTNMPINTGAGMAQNTNTLPNSGMGMNSMQGVNPIRPMEKAPEPVVEPPKKKKTGLILGIIIGSVALIVTVAVAAMLFILNNGDPVSKAVSKIMRGEAPKNVEMNGVITIESNSDDIGTPSATINLKTQGSTSSLINTTSADISLNFKDLGDIKLGIEELYPSNGDLYMKVDNISTALTDFNEIIEKYYNTVRTVEDGAIVEMDATELTEENTEATDPFAESEATGEQNAAEIISEQDDSSVVADVSPFLNIFGGVLEQFDGKWIKIPLSDLGNYSSGISNSSVSCSTGLVSDLKNSSNILAQFYSEDPFVFSTTKDVILASKNSPVYQVVFDDEKINTFVNKVNNTNFANNYKACMQSDEDVFGAVNTSALPNFYVELDDDYNFTRFYMSTDVNKGESTITADVDFTYPTNINVSEPENTTDFTEIMQAVLTTVLMNNEIQDSPVMTE